MQANSCHINAGLVFECKLLLHHNVTRIVAILFAPFVNRMMYMPLLSLPGTAA